MPLDLEEQEQVADLKAWWTQNGTLILVGVLAAAIAFSGWTLWKRHEQSQLGLASALYESVVRAAQGGDAKALRDAGGSLAENYARTPYAAMAALVSARFYFDRGDLKGSEAQLQWVIDRGQSDEMRDLARLRLGAVRLEEKAYDQALALADAPHAAAYDAQYAALKGDVLVAKNQPAEAKSAYKLALEKSAKENNAFRESVRTRLEALGG
jgi:predicted negative regulator of RcsB-dependent stress response